MKNMYIISTYFSSLMRSGTVLTSDFNFLFVNSTPFSMCFAVDVETAHSKRILSCFALLNLMNETIKFCGLFLLIFFEDGRPTTVNAAHFDLLFFLKQGNLWLCQYQPAKKPPIFENKRLFLHCKCCTYRNITFWMELASSKTTGRFICNM